ncbi:MAG: hypothetical protein ACKPA7_21795, partial [Sphaerospermopsis kisseleviana]
PKKRTDKSALALSHIPKPLNSDCTLTTSPTAIALPKTQNSDHTPNTPKQRSHPPNLQKAIAHPHIPKSDRTPQNPKTRSHYPLNFSKYCSLGVNFG